MRKRVRLKKKIKYVRKRKKWTKSQKLIVMFFLIVLGIILLFQYANKKVTPVLTRYAETEIKKLSNLIINKAISKQMTEELNFDNF